MKHRVLQSLIAVLLLFALFAAMIPAGLATYAEEIQDEIDRLQEEADQLASDKEALNAELSETNTQVRTYAEEKQRIDREIELCILERDNINGQIHQYNLLIAEKQAELDELEAEQSALLEQYQLRMRAIQERDKLSIWSVLLTSDSFTDLLARRVMLEEIAKADQRMLQELREKSSDILEAKNELAAEKANLEQKKLELADVERELAAKREQADEMLAELSADKQHLLAEIDAAEAQEAALHEQIAQKEAEYTELLQASPEQLHPSESGFLFPLDPSGFAMLTSPYGMREHPITGNYTMHNGVDLAAYQGTSVYASKSGIVTTAAYNYALGNYVVINHGDGYSTMYGHMTHFIVSEGDDVTQGQTIGYVGSTGVYSTGPHLHFTVYFNGGTVNPMGYISTP